MGLAVRIIFFAIEIAGQIMSTEIGLMASAQVDPISQNNSTPIGTALTMFATLIFMISGAHHECIAAFVRSFQMVPPGTMEFHRSAGEVFVQNTGKIFLYALQMSAPLLAMNFVITLSFAILAKAAPGVNAFNESYAVRITAGLTLLALSLGLTAQLVLSHFRQSPELMLRMMP
jgi:flagellar biosynthesis protein FliR